MPTESSLSRDCPMLALSGVGDRDEGYVCGRRSLLCVELTEGKTEGLEHGQIWRRCGRINRGFEAKYCLEDTVEWH